MNASVEASPHHRGEPRVATLSLARMEAPDALIPQAGAVVIKEMSACGLRLVSEVQLHPDESLVLKVPGELLPLHARVVWVQQSPPAHRRARKSWIAGCRFLGDSIARARLPLPYETLHVRRPFRWGRAFAAIGGVALLALLIFLYVKFAVTIAGSSNLFRAP